MCGIVACTGVREAYPILPNGLKRLEYRGYDSAGIAIATEQQTYDKAVNNIREIIARRGTIISVVTEGDTTVKNKSRFCIEIPHTGELPTPIVACVPLQLLAYHAARARGYDVDKPRNLAKSVSVE